MILEVIYLILKEEIEDENNHRIEQLISTKISDFKLQMGGFLKKFLQNYSNEMSRNSLNPIIRDIEELKTVHNEIKEKRLSIDIQ